MSSKGMSEFDTLGFVIREGGCIRKDLRGDGEKCQAYRLRHRVFSEELGWVPRTTDQMETDEYDSHAVPIGILDGQKRILAYARLVLPDRAFMIEREVSCLVSSNHRVRKEDNTAEVSRLCVSPEARNASVSGRFGTHSLSMLPYKRIYHWCARNRVRYVHIVVDCKIYRLFWAKGFPCPPWGNRWPCPTAAPRLPRWWTSKSSLP